MSFGAVRAPNLRTRIFLRPWLGPEDFRITAGTARLAFLGSAHTKRIRFPADFTRTDVGSAKDADCSSRTRAAGLAYAGAAKRRAMAHAVARAANLKPDL